MMNIYALYQRMGKRVHKYMDDHYSIEQQEDIIDVFGLSLITAFISLGILGFLDPYICGFLVFFSIGLRYQFQGKAHDVHYFNGEVKTLDKFQNAFQYRLNRRGFKIRFFQLDRIIEWKSDAPRFVQKWCKFVAFMEICVNPAWSYHELEDEDYPLDVESVEEIRAYEL